jgi:WD40 repeat protein
MQRYASFTLGAKGNVITAVAWSPSGRDLVVGGHSGLVQLWRVDGEPHFLRSLSGLGPVVQRPEAIQALSFSPDGKLVAATDSQETVGALDSGQENPARFRDRLANLAIWQAAAGSRSRAASLASHQRALRQSRSPAPGRCWP